MFAGLIRFTVLEATLDEALKGRDYFSTVSIGKQALTSHDVAAPSAEAASLKWDAGAAFVLQKEGATVARIAVFRQGKLDGAFKNYLVAYCEVNLASFFTYSGNANTIAANGNTQTSNGNGYGVIIEDSLDLVSPEDSSKVVGSVRVSGKASNWQDLELQVWQSLLLLADFDGNNELSEPELSVLLSAFGSDLSEEEVRELFSKADSDGSGLVSVEELSKFLSLGEHSANGEPSHFSRLVKRCPVDGAELSSDPDKQASNLLYVWMALSAARANHESDLKSGYLTESQAAQSWMLRLSEWASHPLAVTPAAKKKVRRRSYQVGGLRVGSAAAHILIYDRANKLIVEEALSPVLSLAMRNMYQSKVGRALMRRKGLAKRLLTFTVKEGKYRDSPESAKDIVPFVNSFQGQINVEDAELPLDQYKTFNEFFYRKLKPGARPIVAPTDPNVLVSAADCRLQVFADVNEATRFWVKGRNFSVAGLLADTDPEHERSKAFSGGTMAIFRLAPQDYHRYHSPVDGVVAEIIDVPGDLLTVNPIAVNSLFCDVFTVNKRSVMLIDTPTFGRVAYVAIGATLVGSINWTVEIGGKINKGDELGYFAFGGSTCIVLFPNGTVMWDADLTANAHRSLETLVQVGEKIGVKAGSGLEETPSVRAAITKRTVTIAREAGAKPLEERKELQKMFSGEEESLSSPINEEEEEEEEEGEEESGKSSGIGEEQEEESGKSS